jgi:ribosomal protein L11 methyltransferase
VIRLAVRVRREHAELVLAELLELAPGGVEEVQEGETVEYAVYGAPGELPSLPELKAAAGGALVEIATSETADDWQDRWRHFHKPVLIRAPDRHSREARRVPAVRVRPPWEPAAEEPGTAIEEIVIDPGQAFGTGAHASTRQCLELLLSVAQLEPRLGPLVDVGTGSGVLAIAAARLGFSPVLAIDHERESIAAAQANAAANRVEIELRHADLRTQPPLLAAEADNAGAMVLVANLLRPLLLELARAMPSAPAHLLAGGLLPDQVGEVTRVFTDRFGLRERERRESAGWAAVWLDQPRSGTSVAARAIER